MVRVPGSRWHSKRVEKRGQAVAVAARRAWVGPVSKAEAMQSAPTQMMHRVARWAKSIQHPIRVLAGARPGYNTAAAAAAATASYYTTTTAITRRNGPAAAAAAAATEARA
jgi:hypothetical protein